MAAGGSSVAVKFRPTDPKASSLHLIDDCTGIEFFEKNAPQRVRRWIEGDDDSRQRGITFVFRDPRWTDPNGSHDIEFQAIGRVRIIETKGIRSPRTFKGEVIYGFDVSAQEFERSFADYTGGDPVKISQVGDIVRAATLAYLTPTPDTVVNFT